MHLLSTELHACRRQPHGSSTCQSNMHLHWKASKEPSWAPKILMKRNMGTFAIWTCYNKNFADTSYNKELSEVRTLVSASFILSHGLAALLHYRKKKAYHRNSGPLATWHDVSETSLAHSSGAAKGGVGLVQTFPWNFKCNHAPLRVTYQPFFLFFVTSCWHDLKTWECNYHKWFLGAFTVNNVCMRKKQVAVFAKASTLSLIKKEMRIIQKQVPKWKLSEGPPVRTSTYNVNKDW